MSSCVCLYCSFGSVLLFVQSSVFLILHGCKLVFLWTNWNKLRSFSSSHCFLSCLMLLNFVFYYQIHRDLPRSTLFHLVWPPKFRRPLSWRGLSCSLKFESALNVSFAHADKFWIVSRLRHLAPMLSSSSASYLSMQYASSVKPFWSDLFDHWALMDLAGIRASIVYLSYNNTVC